MRELLKMSMAVALAVLVGFGCASGSKINLAGLEENAPGTISEDGKGQGTEIGGEIGGVDGGGEDAEGALRVAGLNGADGNGAGNGVGNGAGDGAGNGAGQNGLDGIDPNAPAGGWADTTAGSGALLGGQNFVKNGNYWAEKVFFDFNRYEIRQTERPKLDSLVEHLRANPTFRVVIEGHTDERGSDEYNRALAERRSLSVQTYLQSQGIEESRMQTVSYGEDRPAVPNAKSEADHQLNRRAEFLVGLP